MFKETPTFIRSTRLEVGVSLNNLDEKKTLLSYSYDIDEVDKDKKEEIGYIFDNTIVNEIWNP